MDVRAFSDRVQEYLRVSGYSQKNLAHELGLNSKVLSRKLRGSENAYLTQMEIKCIIIILARWHVITTQDEVLQLLELAQMQPGSFSAGEWQSPPLDQLAAKPVQAIPISNPIPEMQIRRSNVPVPLTRLIGREWAVERLRQLLGREEVRLVTLMGPGGSGKTRLAMHVAGELADAFAQGVCFVRLTGVRDSAQVPMSIIQALGMTPSSSIPLVQSLVNFLREKELLLVLDNFEQVTEAATVVGELLAEAPGLKVLVTSRVVLHLYGEREFSVPPLDVPDLNLVTSAAELAQYAAVQLFVERAQAVEFDFALTDENAGSVAQICVKLDGLPLAVELAAARVKVLPPAILLDRLTEARLSVLTGGARDLPSRQQTLRNTLTWSYNLLPPGEQRWFARLGVFTGGWSLEATEAMARAGAAEQGSMPAADSFLDMLEQLVDKSLVMRLRMGGGQMRFVILETLREYALERLVEHGELEWLRDWHACYYLGVAEAAEAGLKGENQLVWLARLVAERDNLRAALGWSLQRARARMMLSSELPAVEVCLRLAAALRSYWEWQGYLTEGRVFLDAVLEIPLEEKAGKTVLAARARALSEAARLVCLQNEPVRAVELAEESIALWRQLDESHGLATALFYRGWAAHVQGEHELAKRLYEEGLHLTDDTWLRAQLLFYLGAAAGLTADFEQMRSFYAQSRKLFEQVGDKSAVADVVKDLGGMLILEGNYAGAIDCLLKSIELSHELGHKQFVTSAIGMLGFAVGLREEPDPETASLQAAQLWGAAVSLQDAIGFTPWLNAFALAIQASQQIRHRVDKPRWKSAYEAGRALSEREAIALAYSMREI
jgi:predicted ATPase